MTTKKGYAYNRRFGNMAGRRIYSHLFVRYQLQSGLDFYYWALVVIFIISNSIRLRFRAGRFPNTPPNAKPWRYRQPYGDSSNFKLTARNKQKKFNFDYIKKNKMATKNRIGLDKTKSKQLADNLNNLLADYMMFYQNTRGLHWNIKGDKFFELHLKFE